MRRNHSFRRTRRGPARLRVVVVCVSLVLFSACAAAGADPAIGDSEVAAGLYDVNSTGVDVKFVLEALARRSGENIVVSPEVSGEITAHLSQLTIDAILDHLSVVGGFAWRRTDGTYLVASKEALAPPMPAAATPPEPETLVWTCRNIRPSDVTSLMTKIFPSLTVAEGPNLVTPALESSQSGSGGLSGSSTSSGSAPTNRENRNTIVLTGVPADIARARDVLEKLDVRRAQVSIQVAIAEINSSGNDELGIDWSWNDMVLSEAAATSGIHFGNLTKSPVTFTGAVSALVESGRGNLLAQPNISVIDGECADILIGDRILFPKLVGYSDFGTPIYDKEEERVGIYLQIAPRIARDDIVMTLYPQVSLVTSYLKTQAGDYPQISTREAKTTVSVANGDTLAIGGLIRDDEIREMSKIPLLGDLPIIGGLFRHSKKTLDRTEIVILLSPRIVESDRGDRVSADSGVSEWFTSRGVSK